MGPVPIIPRICTDWSLWSGGQRLVRLAVAWEQSRACTQFGSTECWQPELGSHESIVHGFESSQLSGDPPTHTPDWQVSAPLQRFASAHEAPFETGVWRQPAIGSQVSAVHGLPSSHVRLVPLAHAPALHVSVPSQTLLSLQSVPSATAVEVQPT